MENIITHDFAKIILEDIARIDLWQPIQIPVFSIYNINSYSNI